MHVAGWDYQRHLETCLTLQDIRKDYQYPGSEVLPLRRIGSLPIILGLGTALPVYAPTTTGTATPILTFVRRDATCYIAYVALGSPI
jgi:hypothetical protein